VFGLSPEAADFLRPVMGHFFAQTPYLIFLKI
jgi:hypothetical protein